MSFKLFIIPTVIVSVIYGFAMASIASAGSPVLWEQQCELVNDVVECDIHSDYGIQNVHVLVATGIGDVTVLDEDFQGCPTDVHVSLDPIVLSLTSEMDVLTCGVPLDVECTNCTAEICIGDMPCHDDDEPGVGVGRPDPLPLKSNTSSRSFPIILSSSDILPR